MTVSERVSTTRAARSLRPPLPPTQPALGSGSILTHPARSGLRVHPHPPTLLWAPCNPHPPTLLWAPCPSSPTHPALGAVSTSTGSCRSLVRRTGPGPNGKMGTRRVSCVPCLSECSDCLHPGHPALGGERLRGRAGGLACSVPGERRGLTDGGSLRTGAHRK